MKDIYIYKYIWNITSSCCRVLLHKIQELRSAQEMANSNRIWLYCNWCCYSQPAKIHHFIWILTMQNLELLLLFWYDNVQQVLKMLTIRALNLL